MVTGPALVGCAGKRYPECLQPLVFHFNITDLERSKRNLLSKHSILKGFSRGIRFGLKGELKVLPPALPEIRR
jgi:hypothetical protein